MTDASLPVAYCAPGMHAAAAAILASSGDQVREIIEHAWLEGNDGVLICAPPAETPVEWPVMTEPGIRERLALMSYLPAPCAPSPVIAGLA